jgi:hypothetical protein
MILFLIRKQAIHDLRSTEIELSGGINGVLQYLQKTGFSGGQIADFCRYP